MQKLSLRLQEASDQQGLIPSDPAQRMDVGASRVSRWFWGTVPRRKQPLRLSEILGIALPESATPAAAGGPREATGGPAAAPAGGKRVLTEGDLREALNELEPATTLALYERLLAKAKDPAYLVKHIGLLEGVGQHIRNSAK